MTFFDTTLIRDNFYFVGKLSIVTVVSILRYRWMTVHAMYVNEQISSLLLLTSAPNEKAAELGRRQCQVYKYIIYMYKATWRLRASIIVIVSWIYIAIFRSSAVFFEIHILRNSRKTYNTLKKKNRNP